MPETNDMDLLRAYARDNTESALAELVDRRINLVYSVALRFTGNTEDAEDVTQAVFIILAQKAAGLRQSIVLTGWLYETTRFTAMKFLRTKARRRAREQEACLQSALNEPETDGTWRLLAPHLEEAMSGLGERDRTLLALRFYENKSGAAAAALLGIREAAVHKRTARAVEKLRMFFNKRGIALSAVAITSAVAGNSVQAAPVALAKSVTAVAITKGAAASISTLTLIKGALKLMAWSKAKITVITVAGVLLAASTTTVVVHHLHGQASDASDTDKAWRFPNIGSDTVAKLPPEVKILPTKFPNGGNLSQASGPDSDKFVGINQPVVNILSAAYNWPQARMIFANPAPTGRYDFITTLAQGSREALQQELKNKLRLAGRGETKAMDVMLLKVRNVNAPGVRPPIQGGNSYLNHDGNKIEIKWANEPLSKITSFLESGSPMPVIDQTGATNRCSIDIKWVEPGGQDMEHTALRQVLLDQLGVEFVPTNMPVEMLVVEKIQ